MQAVLAVVGCVAGVAVWALGSAAAVLVAGLVLGAVVPFTLIVILPTNERLLDPTLDPGSAETAALLARWGRLHALRSLASGIAFLRLSLHRPGIV